MKNISFERVAWKDGFWQEKARMNREKSIPAVRARFEETGRFAALAFQPMPQGAAVHYFYDSDVAKWIEGVSYEIAKDRAAMREQESFVDELIRRMRENQREDGYLNSYYQRVAPGEEFTGRQNHELYCAGHLIEAAIAYLHATGKREFFDVVLKYVDCIERAFVTEKTAKFVTPGHEEIEYALLRLYCETGDRRHFALAEFFLDARGRREEQTYPFATAAYDQSDRPVRELEDASGHAVRAVYLYRAMAKYALMTGDAAMRAACERLYESLCRRMYVTGGIGSARLGETLTVDYDLPNLTAYSESCAAIGFALFCAEMQGFGRDSRYADTVERILYNSFLSSVSLCGEKFFYENPLEICLRERDKEVSIEKSHRAALPIVQRVRVFECSCCPPNINRFFPQVAGLIYAEDERGLIVNQYISSACEGLTVTTDYPVTGRVRIEGKGYAHGEIALRMPSWCRGYRLTKDGVPATAAEEGGYLVLAVPKDFCLQLDFDMRPTFWESNPRVRENAGKVALCRGPVVYCMEGADNGENLFALSVDTAGRIAEEPDPLTGLVRLSAKGFRDEPFRDLYRESEGARRPVDLRFIPYFAFANRGETDMEVWVRKK